MADVLPAFPKPGQIRQRKPAVKIFPDGREVCQKNAAGKREYKARVEQMWNRQKGLCGLMLSAACPKEIYLREATFEHLNGRTAGKRDDRTEILQIGPDGKTVKEPINCSACWACNSEKGSRRLNRGNTNNNVA